MEIIKYFDYKIKNYFWLSIIISILILGVAVYLHYSDATNIKSNKEQIQMLELKVQENRQELLHKMSLFYQKEHIEDTLKIE